MPSGGSSRFSGELIYREASSAYTGGMRLDIQFVDRVGIAHEVLAVFAARGLNVVAVEVDPPHVYIDAPSLQAGESPSLRQALGGIAGVIEVLPVDLLPGARRRLHLSALIGALADPVLAVGPAGEILVANAAVAAAVGVSAEALARLSLGSLFDQAELLGELIGSGFHMPLREVTLHGESFLLDAQPIVEADAVAGGVVTLHSPSRIGERLNALKHYSEEGFSSLLGGSPPMRALKVRAARVATVDAPLLILGETGTGKELIAHACHQASARREAPFLALNCAALPENLAESELFGYAPGAFSGAQRGGKPGLLEMASHGTVFLDEIGEMSPYLQAKLLRFLNDGTFRRVGGERELKIDVRIISATHRNLEHMIVAGGFREDLYYRLNVLSLQVPPLRERSEDILGLARHFIDRACAQAQRSPCRLSPAACADLLANPWPGNVRQLENVIFRAVTMSDRQLLYPADLELAGSTVAEKASGVVAGISWEAARENFERELLQRLYPDFPSSRKLALHLKTSHTTVAKKLRKYGLGER